MQILYSYTRTCAVRKNGISQKGVNMKHNRSKPSTVKEVKKKGKKKGEQGEESKRNKGEKERGIENTN